MKNINTNLLIGFLFVSILGTLAHFTYDWSGNNELVGLVTAVNESTWEHMKLLFFPALLYLPIATYFLREEYPHIAEAMVLGILVGTLAIPVLFYTYSDVLGYNLAPLDIGTFFVAVAITFFITYRYADRELPGSGFLFVLLIAFALAFLFFTYNPPELGIFADPTDTSALDSVLKKYRQS